MSPVPARFASQQSTVRRIAAGLAMVVTLGIVLGMGALADQSYDRTLMALADSAPTHVVVVSAPRPVQG
jgi:hypothetical protein